MTHINIGPAKTRNLMVKSIYLTLVTFLFETCQRKRETTFMERETTFIEQETT